MRHRKKIAKLSLTRNVRKALFRNMSQSLFKYESVKTTLVKAKALRPYVEKMITKAKVDTVHHKRLVMKQLYNRSIMLKLFNDIAPRFSERHGGYLRITKLGKRRSDGTEMAILDFVDTV